MIDLNLRNFSPAPHGCPAPKISLAEWAYLHAHLIWIYDGPVDPEGRHGTLFAPHLTAWLLHAGSVELRAGDRRFTAKTGEWIFPPPGEVWRAFSEDARILSVRFRATWPGGEELFSEGLGVRLRADEYPQLEHAARPLAALVRDEFSRSDRHLLDTPATLGAHLRLQTLFSHWLEVCVETLTQVGVVPTRLGHIDSRVLRAVRLIEQHNPGAGFDERVLAAHVGLSVSRLNRLFARQFGCSCRGYFERRRREQALAALQGSAHTIKEIAFSLGFSSLSHFSAWVKQQFGRSPRLIRERSRGVQPL
ncbi:MAG TPA: AraC family transcriptional regulator [Opitutus sp.]|nr:AraC family transcriptional regulator [Opitutus sp.]